MPKPKQITPPERKRYAEMAGINEQYLYQCLTGRRDMGAAEAVRVERATRGMLTRRDLCQSSFASIWPELAQRGKKHVTETDGLNRAVPVE